MRHLDAYSQKIDGEYFSVNKYLLLFLMILALELERTELTSRCDHLKSELANSHQQVKDYDEALNRQNVEHAKSLVCPHMVFKKCKLFLARTSTRKARRIVESSHRPQRSNGKDKQQLQIRAQATGSRN
jgi:hypothetical protein